MNHQYLAICIIALASCWLVPGTAVGQLAARDSFDATHGEGFAGQRSGWKFSARKKAARIDNGLHMKVGEQNFGAGGAMEIRGFGDRDNPLRRQLADAYSRDELYLRFLLRYDAASIDQPDAKQSGEYFVLWLDDIDGSDGATHNQSVPNIGLHVPAAGPNKNKNLFMVRIGSTQEAYTQVELEGDRTYLVVGRLAKSTPGLGAPYDTFQIWIDPKVDDRDAPQATSQSKQGIRLVEWVGFATGKKTEASDRIVVDELALGGSWESVLGLPEQRRERPLPSGALQQVDFRRDVFPILQSRCFDCHSGDDSDSGIRLDTWDELLGHSTGNALVVAGQASASVLIERVTAPADSDERMPPDGDLLTAAEVEMLKRWIDQGIAWDEKLLPSPAPQSDHWAFQPVARPPLPKVANAAWVRNPIDAFVAAGHEQQGLSPSPPALPYELARRASFGVTGLPASSDDVERLSRKGEETAYEQWVDRLLASPQYGERWARHWLDLARWAESNDYQHNDLRLHAWRYRDYVVRSFNDDKPYDRFVREQLAGDELSPYADDHLIATGFLAAARVSGNEMDEAIRRNEMLVDMVNATASAFLGLTIECAQCHNHKFDPITARDYYRLQAYFAKGQLGNLVLRDAAAPSRENGPPDPKDRAPLQTFGFLAPSTSATAIKRLPLEKIRYPLPFDPAALAKTKTHILIRGEVDSLGPVVQPGWPAVLGPDNDSEHAEQHPRTALADWLTARDNPLTARVWVNRLWQYHFGQGLVDHASDFGTRTVAPIQQPLLDWLAAELMESGWSTRHIQRLILTSNTYRQASRHNARNARIDPDNHYYWRFVPRRLEAEAIRDAALAVSGVLDLARGGPSVALNDKAAQSRRSLYLLQKRRELPEMQTLFDGNVGLVSCGGRGTSTVPLQPLYLLNNPFMLRCATAMAQRVAAQAGTDRGSQVDAAFRLALGRPPDERERAAAVAFLEMPAPRGKPEEPQAVDRSLVHFCHAILNLNEFCYVQ